MRLLTTTCALLISLLSYGQPPQNNSWVFGVQTGIEFTPDGPEVLSTGIDCGFDRAPATISNFQGELMYYADETNVYDISGFPLSNGSYGSNCSESIFIPNPGDPNQIYHIRSFLSGGGLEYSIIDIALNDVLEGFQSISIDNLGGQLAAGLKPDGSGYWLISVDNNSGGTTGYVNVYDVSPDGIELNSVYTEDWLFIGWGGVIDAAELSPDCSVLAISFKAHYIGLFQFDNELGEITGSINDSFDNGGWTSDYAQVAFSPNSQYIYTVAEGYFQLSKYDISSFNGGIIGASQTSIAVDNSSPWTDIKLGNDGAIYVYNSGNNTLDRISNPDAPGDDVGFESNVVDIPSDVTSYFPETTHFQCGVLSPFFIPETFDVCLGEETQFELSYNFSPDSVQWDFGDPDGGLDNLSTLEEPTYTYDEIGSYIVGLDVWFNGELTTFELVASVFDFPVLDLGPDQTICEGEIALLEAGVADNYEWSNGSDDAAISVTESGIYGVVASNGVCAVEDEIIVTVIPALFVDLGNDLFPCPDDEVVLSAGQEATWNTGESAMSINVTESGEYTATLQNQCFTVQDDIQVQFVTLPEISLPELKTACTGDSVLLTLAIDTQSVEWISSSEILAGDSVYVQYSDVFIANYIYQGCEASAQTEIEFLNGVDLSLITMPNIFTPNADQSNNTFRPMNIANGGTNPCNFSLFNAEMQVFNRWGNLMSEGSCSWAGVNQNGQDCSEGVYYYIINMESNCPGAVNQKELTGSFTLAR